jgi:hypothetical protein
MKLGKEQILGLVGCAFLIGFADGGIAQMSRHGGGDGMGGMGPGPGEGGSTQTYDTTFTFLHFSGSGNCRMCHNGLVDENGTDVSIEKQWSSTAMAHAGRDPIWRAKVSSELARNPQLADIINKKCSRCHNPMANTEADYNGDAPSILTDLRDPANEYYDAAADGVSCTLCHQISDSTDLGTTAGFSGHYSIDTYANPVDRLIYGPYTNVFAEPMRNNVSYSINYSPHINESKLCATCHNLYTPYVDEAGNVISTPETEFAEQMSYSEWLASDYTNTRSCQDCHMPRTNGVVMASRPMWLNTLRDDFATHKLIGGNVLLLDILQNNQAELDANVADIPQSMLETKDMLRSAAGIELAENSLAGGTLAFTLRVNSYTGHKLPTGIPLRRIILHVKVTDMRGRTIFESGRINSGGSVAGLDSDLDSTTYEPHYDLITSQDQVQAYEAIMQNDLGEVTYTLLRAGGMLKDNRLLPPGFDKNTVPEDIGVAGAASDDNDFIGGGDEISFRIPVGKGSKYTVQAELVYQTLSSAFLQDLKKNSTQELNDLAAMYETSSAKAVIMTGKTFNITQ